MQQNILTFSIFFLQFKLGNVEHLFQLMIEKTIKMPVTTYSARNQ